MKQEISGEEVQNFVSVFKSSEQIFEKENDYNNPVDVFRDVQICGNAESFPIKNSFNYDGSFGINDSK